MKKTTAFLLVLFMTFSLTACQNQKSGSTTNNNDTSALETQTASENESTFENHEGKNNVLITYFSLWGNSTYPDDIDATTSASIVVDNDERYGTTEYVAQMIQKNIGGDIHLIQTVDPYPADFDEVTDQNHEEMNAGTLPKLIKSSLNISQYDTVFIGYPVWATNVPQAIFSFLSEYDLSGKTIVPFCTHDGYGAGGSYENIAEAVPNAVDVLDGLAIEALDVPKAADKVVQWLEEIELKRNFSDAAQVKETPLIITIGDTVLEGVLYNTDLANEIRKYFPLTVAMSGFGGREYYGGIDFVPVNAGDGQLNFENGDITYCSANNTMAIFYAQTDSPNLSMEVIPIGRVTSELGIFNELPESADITFNFAK